MILIDSHCHIDGEQFDVDRDEVVQRAKDVGVAAMLNVGTGDPHSDDFRRAVAVADKYENVFASVGVHPHDAKLYDDKAENHLIDLIRSSKKVIAWGEIDPDFANAPILVAYEQDGKPIADKQGAIRLIVPTDGHGGRYVSGLVSLEVRDAPAIDK